MYVVSRLLIPEYNIKLVVHHDTGETSLRRFEGSLIYRFVDYAYKLSNVISLFSRWCI